MLLAVFYSQYGLEIKNLMDKIEQLEKSLSEMYRELWQLEEDCRWIEADINQLEQQIEVEKALQNE